MCVKGSIFQPHNPFSSLLAADLISKKLSKQLDRYTSKDVTAIKCINEFNNNNNNNNNNVLIPDRPTNNVYNMFFF